MGIVLCVHGAEHEPAMTVGAAIVAPGRGDIRLHRMEVAHGAGVAVEASDALRERRQQVAGVRDSEAAQPIVEREFDGRAVGRQSVQATTVDVGPQQLGSDRIPDRTLAELVAAFDHDRGRHPPHSHQRPSPERTSIDNLSPSRCRT